LQKTGWSNSCRICPWKRTFVWQILIKIKKNIIEEFKQCIHSDIKTYIDEHNDSSLVEANTMADDYTRTHTLIYLKNKRAGGVPNLNYLLIIILINQNQVLWRKNKNSYSPLEINKGELPKSFSYCNKRGTMFRMFFHKDNVRIYNTIK
jgi:hypothetical protein